MPDKQVVLIRRKARRFCVCFQFLVRTGATVFPAISRVAKALFRSRLTRSIGLTFLLVLTCLFAMLPPPAEKGGDGGFKRFRRFRHRIFNTGRDFGIHGSCNEAVFLKFAQLESQHMLAHARNGSLQFTKSMDSMMQQP